jgi:sugar lactone lactonase YvrE
MRMIPRDRRDRLGEGPIWSPSEQALFWVDILGKKLNRLRPSDDSVTCWDLPTPTGWVIERRSAPGFIAGTKDGIATLTLDPLVVTVLAAPEPDLPQHRLNDAKADAAGRLYFGTMPMACDTPTGSLYRYDPDGRLTRLDSGYSVANGPAISADGSTLFHTDSVAGRIYRFAVRADGSLGPRALFRQFTSDEGSPDGMTFDNEGGLWVACWGAGRVVRLRPDAMIDQIITLPASQTSSVSFAGELLDRMFVTSASEGVDEAAGGALFEVAPGRIGLAAHTFAG